MEMFGSPSPIGFWTETFFFFLTVWKVVSRGICEMVYRTVLGLHSTEAYVLAEKMHILCFLCHTTAVTHQDVKDDMNFFSMVNCKRFGFAEVCFIHMICDVDHEKYIRLLLKSHITFSQYTKQNTFIADKSLNT